MRTTWPVIGDRQNNDIINYLTNPPLMAAITFEIQAFQLFQWKFVFDFQN